MDQCEKQEERLHSFAGRFVTEESFLWNNTKLLPSEEPQQKEWIKKQAAAPSQPQTHCHCPLGNTYQYVLTEPYTFTDCLKIKKNTIVGWGVFLK